MFKFLFTKYGQKPKNNREEYTPVLEGHKQIHDETEGSEFLDDVVEIEESPSADVEEDRA